jgi:hypothetical protein
MNSLDTIQKKADFKSRKCDLLKSAFFRGFRYKTVIFLPKAIS